MSEETIHESRRRLQQVWWGVLAGVLAALVFAAAVYAAVPSRAGAGVPDPVSRGAAAP